VSILSNDFFVLILYNVGDVYEGEYVNEKKHGKGKYTSANGDVYEGDFVEGKKCGQGMFTYSSGNVYSGEYKDGKQNGQVLLTPLLIHSFTDVPPGSLNISMLYFWSYRVHTHMLLEMFMWDNMRMEKCMER
jgi:hypothetical protein